MNSPQQTTQRSKVVLPTKNSVSKSGYFSSLPSQKNRTTKRTINTNIFSCHKCRYRKCTGLDWTGKCTHYNDTYLYLTTVCLSSSRVDISANKEQCARITKWEIQYSDNLIIWGNCTCNQYSLVFTDWGQSSTQYLFVSRREGLGSGSPESEVTKQGCH